MKLGELTAGLAVAEIVGDAGTEVSALAYDSREVTPGALFFCVRGFRSDGHVFAAEAVERGASGLVDQWRLELPVAQVVVPDTRAVMAPIASNFFGNPTSELEVAGITGTNGKTTTAFLLRTILEAAGRRSGLLGTVKSVVGGVDEDVDRTTPEAIDLQAAFRRMLHAGDQACVMEVSSHALTLHRADCIEFDVAVFTNLTQEHLDFHPDMNGYFAAKRALFVPAAGDPRPKAAVINVDDPYGRRLADELESTTFSAAGGEADFRAEDVSFDRSGASFTCSTPAGKVRVEISLPGHFNIANALAAIAAASVMGVEPEGAADALAEADIVPGRFEPVEVGQPFTVVVDYAHTPDSLENVLRAARKLTDGRMICVFGAGGDRDRTKRPLMGRAVAELADLAVVTSDNPRSEDPDAIIGEILAGSGTEGVRVEPDRRAAIGLGLAEAVPGDVVVIAGKGHEQGQEFEDGRKVPFDDRRVASEELRKLTTTTGER